MLHQLNPEIDINSINPAHFLQSEFGWTLQRIAEEMKYSDGAVRAWSCGDRNAHYRAKERAVEVYLIHRQ
jgi:hypothetical protein